MAPQVVCRVESQGDVGNCRRQVVRVATDSGLDETAAGRVAVIATELATNLALHAGKGDLLVQSLPGPGGAAVEILSIDAGPGMADPERCLRDGYSTKGTAGNGLGAVKRLSDEFDLFSQQEKGTVVLARVHREAPAAVASWRWGVISTPAPGETVVGDSWRLTRNAGDVRVFVADGLGHGPLASAAAEAAASLFETESTLGLKPFLDRAHHSLRSTRGAAVAVALCSPGTRKLQYAGVGNISGMIVSPGGQARGLMSHNGTVGAEMRTAQELPYEWAAGDRLIMHSDGIATRWQLGTYAGLGLLHPALTGAILYRDFLRGRDDATVLVLELAA